MFSCRFVPVKIKRKTPCVSGAVALNGLAPTCFTMSKSYLNSMADSNSTACASPFHVIQQIPRERLYEIERDMAIIIPTRDERLRLLEGVLCGIPHDCLAVIISNSQQEPVDRFRMERNMIDAFCRYAKKVRRHPSAIPRTGPHLRTWRLPPRHRRQGACAARQSRRNARRHSARPAARQTVRGFHRFRQFFPGGRV